jgi:hypothetical protein
LFFFTSSALGYEKMLDTKWKLDDERGKGFRLNSDQGTLFEEVEVLDYESKLENYIMEGNTKTNGDLYIFGLDNCFLPKHTNQILAEWQSSNQRFKVLKEDGTEARKGSFYINYKNYGSSPEQVVKFIFK